MVPESLGKNLTMTGSSSESGLKFLSPSLLRRIGSAICDGGNSFEVAGRGMGDGARRAGLRTGPDTQSIGRAEGRQTQAHESNDQ